MKLSDIGGTGLARCLLLRKDGGVCSNCAFSKWNWHVDEVFAKVNSMRNFLWRAVDHEGEVLEAVVTKHRNKQAVLKLLKKMMK